jgi:hypothetical protein
MGPGRMTNAASESKQASSNAHSEGCCHAVSDVQVRRKMVPDYVLPAVASLK